MYDGHQDPDTEPGTSECLLLTSLALGESPGVCLISGFSESGPKAFAPFSRRSQHAEENSDLGIECL